MGACIGSDGGQRLFYLPQNRETILDKDAPNETISYRVNLLQELHLAILQLEGASGSLPGHFTVRRLVRPYLAAGSIAGHYAVL